MTKHELRRRARSKTSRRAIRGLTLLEMLVVVTIMGLVAGMIGIAMQGTFIDAQTKTAKSEIRTLCNAFDLYQIRFASYPATAQGMQALVKPPGGVDGIIDRVPIDPWGKPYVYARPDPRGEKKYLVASAGPDGLMDTEDDLRN